MSKLFRTITTRNDNQRPARAAAVEGSYTKIFIRDLRVDMKIGIYDHEKAEVQPVVINLEAVVTPPADWRVDSYDNVVCYATIAEAIRKMAGSGHINLLETFAEHIADFCLQNGQIESVMVRVEKTAVFTFAQSAGVEIRRMRGA